MHNLPLLPMAIIIDEAMKMCGVLVGRIDRTCKFARPYRPVVVGLGRVSIRVVYKPQTSSSGPGAGKYKSGLQAALSLVKGARLFTCRVDIPANIQPTTQSERR